MRTWKVSLILMVNAAPLAASGSAAKVIDIWGGGSESIALRSDGTVWAWGWNLKGQIGDGTAGGDKTTPLQVIFFNKQVYMPFVAG
jgi:alpha-tubulin suppressor-like RCC1 family protein